VAAVLNLYYKRGIRMSRITLPVKIMKLRKDYEMTFELEIVTAAAINVLW
jgi:hypothetical protein